MPGPGRYDDILDTFTRHVAEKGYDGVNFGSMAAELGISKGTIVHHFGTKDRLLAALHENYMNKRIAELEYMIEHLATPPEQLAAALHAFIIYHDYDRSPTVAFQREAVRFADHESMATGAQLRQDYFVLVREIVEAGLTAGFFRPVDVGIDTLLMFGSAQWAWTWFRPDGPEPVEAVASAFVDLILGSLLTDRSSLAELSNPDGHPAAIVRDALNHVAEGRHQEKTGAAVPA